MYKNKERLRQYSLNKKKHNSNVVIGTDTDTRNNNNNNKKVANLTSQMKF